MTVRQMCAAGQQWLRPVLVASWIFAAVELAAAPQTIPGQAPAGSNVSSSVGAIPPARRESATSPSLTDDVLDLLNEPTSQQQTEKRRAMLPTDVQLDGGILEEQSDNPLQLVRQSMLIAAGFLERGETDANTQQLQSDIVRRLDELIERLDQPQSRQQSQASQPTKSQNNSETSQQLPQRQSAQSQPAKGQPAGADDTEQNVNQKQSSGPDSNEPQRLSARTTKVQLADPRALQQQVWGQLPERTRQQMQSRMVEQFLPSYRQEIEAYYRALAK